MDRSDLTDVQYDALLNAIFDIVAEKGPSHTTMDLVARRLGMSKRTLYEIFESKEAMLRHVLIFIHHKHHTEVLQILRSTDNVMEAIVLTLLYQQEVMKNLSPAFFRDMDIRHPELKRDYQKRDLAGGDLILQAIKSGIRQKVFRTGINYEVVVRLLRVQMESLKRMEEVFPPDITPAEAYHTICTGFLRSIATDKGMKILEELLASDPDRLLYRNKPTQNDTK